MSSFRGAGVSIPAEKDSHATGWTTSSNETMTPLDCDSQRRKHPQWGSLSPALRLADRCQSIRFPETESLPPIQVARSLCGGSLSGAATFPRGAHLLLAHRRNNHHDSRRSFVLPFCGSRQLSFKQKSVYSPRSFPVDDPPDGTEFCLDSGRASRMSGGDQALDKNGSPQGITLSSLDPLRTVRGRL